jgi:hypothetical protein
MTQQFKHYLKNTLIGFGSLLAIASPLLTSSVHASEDTIVKASKNKPAPLWMQVAVHDNGTAMFVEGNGVVQEAMAEGLYVKFWGQMENPSESMSATLFVAAECSSRSYQILRTNLFNPDNGQLLESYVYPAELAELKIAQEGSMIQYAIDYACDS